MEYEIFVSQKSSSLIENNWVADDVILCFDSGGTLIIPVPMTAIAPLEYSNNSFLGRLCISKWADC